MATDWMKSFKADRYQCISLDVSKVVYSDKEDFEHSLQVNLESWKAAGVRGISIRIPLRHSALVETCAKLDFDFHHAKPGYVMMNKWLIEGQLNQLPAYANQYIGAGGFVVNNRQQVLVIREKFQPNPRWKLPGGHVDEGEDIPSACQREVFEETGVKSEFVSLLSFRHQHNYRYGCSDIYFVCLMKPVSEDITPCEKEIAECKWMDLDEYENADITDANRFFVTQYRKTVEDNQHISAQPVLSFDKTKHNLIFSVQNQEKSKT